MKSSTQPMAIKLFRNQKVTVASLTKATPDIWLLRFTFPEIRSFSFLPGQFVNVGHPNVLKETVGLGNGMASNSQQKPLLKRAFSIASPPHFIDDPGCIELCIKRDEKGKLSPMLTSVSAGDTLEIDGPFGIFTLRENAEEYLFIAGGSGIAPLASMIRHLLYTDVAAPITLIYSVKTPNDFCYHHEFEELMEKHKTFHVIATCTRLSSSSQSSDAASAAGPKFWKGHTERISSALVSQAIQNKSKVLSYVCGPPTFVDSIRSCLEEQGLKKEQIMFERWG